MELLPLQQHARFAEALGALGRRAELREEGAAGRVLTIWRRLPLLGEVGYLPRGPIWQGGDVGERAAALRALAARGLRLLEAEAPCPSLRLAGFRQVATPAHVAEIDLTASPEARRAALRPTWRHALRRAEGAGLRVRVQRFAGDPGHWLLAREAAQRRARGYRAAPQALACAFARTDRDAARLWVALDGFEPVAGILALLHPPVATYQIGWTGERGRRLSAHRLLLMAAADALAAEGYRRLDLGTVDAEAAPGLALFKTGAGGRLRALGGSWLRLPFPRPRG